VNVECGCECVSIRSDENVYAHLRCLMNLLPKLFPFLTTFGHIHARVIRTQRRNTIHMQHEVKFSIEKLHKKSSLKGSQESFSILMFNLKQSKRSKQMLK